MTAFFAVGEGWHNNHHRYQRAARNGFYWWEFDPTWYVIRLMAAVGLAWDVQPVPERIYEEARARRRDRAARSTIAVPSVVEPTSTLRSAIETRPRESIELDRGSSSYPIRTSATSGR